MDWFDRIDWPLSITLSVVATTLINLICWALRWIKNVDAYERGFDDGLRSSLARLAKMRYVKEHDVCIAVVPEEEYKKERDQFR